MDIKTVKFSAGDLEKLELADKERVNYLVALAHHKLLESVAFKYINALNNDERIAASNPIQIMNALLKLVKILNDLPEGRLKLVQAIKEKLNAVTPLDEIKNPSKES